MTESIYKEILLLSEKMLASGMAQDWPTLISLESERQTLLEKSKITTIDTNSAHLIMQIQECDNLLKEKIESWKAHVKILLREK